MSGPKVRGMFLDADGRQLTVVEIIDLMLAEGWLDAEIVERLGDGLTPSPARRRLVALVAERSDNPVPAEPIALPAGIVAAYRRAWRRNTDRRPTQVDIAREMRVTEEAVRDALREAHVADYRDIHALIDPEPAPERQVPRG